MLKKLQSNFSIAKDWYHTYRKTISLSSKIKIKNKQLAKELEEACHKRQGVLTYAEYLHITQFGTHGFYANTTVHGKTDVEKRWGTALASYCQKQGYDTIVEFGCGTGELGVATVKAYKHLTNKFLSWTGIEIDTKIHEKIFENFQRQQLNNAIESITASLEKIQTKQNSLFVFPYSLDSIPPHIFLNTEETPLYPNAILGITVENAMLSEEIIPPALLQKKGITLERGVFTQNGYAFDLATWKLRRGQRAYIAPDVFRIIDTCAKKMKQNSGIVIIDEFMNEPWSFNFGNLGTPKSLYEKNLSCHERDRYYRQSGKHNCYYPQYVYSLYSFLHAVGFTAISYEVEQKKAAELEGKRWMPLKENYHTLAFIATGLSKKSSALLPVTFNPKKII